MENLSGALQENVLTLLCFDDDAAKMIRGVVKVSHFESVFFREIASVAISFLDTFGKAIKEHLSDELDHLINGEDTKKAKVYKEVLADLYASKDTVNKEYVVSQLDRFLRQQNLKIGLLDAVRALQEGDLEVAEASVSKALETRVQTFNPGLLLWEKSDALKFYDFLDEPSIPMGIAKLDARGLGPRRKELCMMIAPPKKGKSWWLIQCGKSSVLHRMKVLHVTLEMSENLVSQRYIQAFFSVAKSEGKVRLPYFVKDESGGFMAIEYIDTTRVSLLDPSSRKYVGTKLASMKRRLPLVIKEFPTGGLTIQALKSYLAMLEQMHKFVPDVIVMDYADLMQVGGENTRVEIGNIYKDLRGIAVSHNLAMITASQGNRMSSSARLITEDMVAEDWSKIATCDTVFTYNQTMEEKKRGLARMFVSNARSEHDKITVLMTQQYQLGQFCLDSVDMVDNYWESVLEGKSPDESNKYQRRAPK